MKNAIFFRYDENLNSWESSVFVSHYRFKAFLTWEKVIEVVRENPRRVAYFNGNFPLVLSVATWLIHDISVFSVKTVSNIQVFSFKGYKITVDNRPDGTINASIRKSIRKSK